jgi:isopenicillin-N N-acyltransferase-like protein
LPLPLDKQLIADFISCNPEYFETYVLLGNYFKDQRQKEQALIYYQKALTKEITTVQDKEQIFKNIDNLSAQN